jgi:hypothetical protein
VDDADVQVLDERQDVSSGVFASDADVVEAAAVAEGDGAGGADLVGAGCRWPDRRVRLSGGRRKPRRGWSGREGFVGSLGVVVAGERVELGLEFGEGGRLGVLGGEPVLEGLLEPLDLALGLRVVGLTVFLLGQRLLLAR